MKIKTLILGLAPALLLIGAAAYAGKYSDTINLFRHAGESSSFFQRSYGYAVFPKIGEGTTLPPTPKVGSTCQPSGAAIPFVFGK